MDFLPFKKPPPQIKTTKFAAPQQVVGKAGPLFPLFQGQLRCGLLLRRYGGATTAPNRWKNSGPPKLGFEKNSPQKIGSNF